MLISWYICMFMVLLVYLQFLFISKRFFFLFIMNFYDANDNCHLISHCVIFINRSEKTWSQLLLWYKKKGKGKIKKKELKTFVFTLFLCYSECFYVQYLWTFCFAVERQTFSCVIKSMDSRRYIWSSLKLYLHHCHLNLQLNWWKPTLLFAQPLMITWH